MADISNSNTAECKKEGKMSGLDERTKTRLEFILDEVCSTLPKGGDHESRSLCSARGPVRRHSKNSPMPGKGLLFS